MASAPPWADFQEGATADPATDPSQLPRAQRNALLAAKIREPNVSDTDVLNYAQQLGLTITGHLRENLHNPHAGVVSADEPATSEGPWNDFQAAPPPPPPPDTSWGHDLAVGARGVAEGAIDLGNFANMLPGIGLGVPERLLGIPSPGADLRDKLGQTGFGVPQTSRQQFLQSAVRGATGAGPFGVEGGVAGALTAMGTGATSGLAGEGAKQAGYGPGVQFLASLAGGGLVAGPTALARKAGPMLEGTGASDLVAAGERQGVPLSAADVNPRLRNVNAYLEASAGSHGPVRANMDAGTSAMEARVQNLAPSGAPQDAVGAGTQIQTAGRRYISESRNTRAALYGRAEGLAGDAQVTPSGTLQAIDDHIARLSETPNANAADLGVLNTLRRDLVNADGTPKALSVAAVRDVRRQARALANQASLDPGRTDMIVNSVAAAGTRDITSQLEAANPRAAAAYATADAFHGQRADMIREVVSRFLGPKNQPYAPERALATMKSMAKGVGGDDGRLGRMLDTLEPGEHADIAATFAENLGRRSPEEPFSPALFVSQVRQIAPEARARLFGKDGAAAIDDLIALGIAKRGTAGALNSSRTGVVNSYRDTLRASVGSLFGGGVGYAAGGPIGAAVGAAAPAAGGAVARNAAAKLFTNPGFVRWLARAPRTSGQSAIQSHIGKLSVVAASQPQIANEVRALQARLSEAFGQGNLKAAANPSEQKQDAGSAPIEENQ
jgi:hypothetical protein